MMSATVHGEWEEYHQRAARSNKALNDSGLAAYHLDMYAWHKIKRLELIAKR